MDGLVLVNTVDGLVLALVPGIPVLDTQDMGTLELAWAQLHQACTVLTLTALVDTAVPMGELLVDTVVPTVPMAPRARMVVDMATTPGEKLSKHLSTVIM